LELEFTEVVDGFLGPSLESILRLRWGVVLLEGPFSNSTIDALLRLQNSFGLEIRIWAISEQGAPVSIEKIPNNSISIKGFHQLLFNHYASSLLFEFEKNGFCYTDEERSFIVVCGTDFFIKSISPTSVSVLKEMFYDYARERYPSVSEKFEKLWNLYVERSYIQ
jgi:hypothetical protein